MLVKEILHQRSARQLQTYATSAELTTAATRLFRCFISAWHVSPVLEFFPETLVVGVQRFGVFLLVSAFIHGGQQVVYEPGMESTT